MNPILASWTTPFGLPPFDRIAPEHIQPAFEAALAEHEAELAAISSNPEPPTVANTLDALERSGTTLERVSHLFNNLASSLGGDALEAIERWAAPRLAAHHARLRLDPALFARIDALHAQRDTLDLAPDAARLLQRTHDGFRRAGAALPAADRQRLATIAERLAALQTRFRQNLVHDERAWHLALTEQDLQGLPGFVVDGAAAAARERDLHGWVVPLTRPMMEMFLTHSPRRDLRRALHEAWTRRGTHPGEHDNRPIIPEILALRAERARLLGAEDFATFRLADTMAATPEAVSGLLERVWHPARRRAEAEYRAIADAVRADGLNDAPAAWDWRHYAERVRRAEFALDDSETKPYFPLAAMEAAVFDTAHRLFGLAFRPIEDAALYHPDARAYEVTDETGHVGVLITDQLARPGKRSGAWMASYRPQRAIDAEIRPIVVINNNFVRGEPTLLSFDDARTLFHEFGHALHGLLSRVRYPSQSGTRVLRDFVEFPSQLLEHWLEQPGTLRRHARHHATGKPIPDALIDRLLAARNAGQGFRTVEYVGSAMIDLALHRLPDPASLDLDAFERDFLREIGMPEAIGLRARPAHFSHLFDGDSYASGYYAYLWAEVLDADGFAAFEEAGDPFDPDTARRLRGVLSAGDTVEPMTLYRGFRGREPEVSALLAKRGLEDVLS